MRKLRNNCLKTKNNCKTSYVSYVSYTSLVWEFESLRMWEIEILRVLIGCKKKC